MNPNKAIKIARAVRNYPGGISELTLIWRIAYSKFGLEYRQVNDGDTLPFVTNAIPDHCIREWLTKFVRPQEHLQEDSYFLVAPPSEAWHEVIDTIIDAFTGDV